MNRTAGFERHLDLKMEQLGYSQDRYEFDAVGGRPAVKVSGASQMELRELAKRLAPDFNARVKGDVLVFMPVKHLWTVGASTRTAAAVSRARERAVMDLEKGWEALDSAKTSLQKAMRESGNTPQEMTEDAHAVRILEGMCYELSGLKRSVAG